MAPNGSQTPKISEIWKFSEIRHIIVQSKGFFIANPIFEVLNKNYLILVMYDVIKITKKLVETPNLSKVWHVIHRSKGFLMVNNILSVLDFLY